MDDEKIVQLYWDRDQAAITATAEKYGGYCGTVARNILGNREDAEECVNDTWLNAWSAMPPHRPEVLRTFLGKITRRLSLNRYQQNTAEKRGGGETALVLDELAEVVSGQDGGAEEELDRQELVRAINGFLAALSDQKRDIFVCRYWYLESVGGIASRLGITENQVSVTLNRLRRKLRRCLREGGFEL